MVELECEEGEYISPVRANFGRFDSGICNPTGNKVWSTRCIQPTTLRQVNSICEGRRSCSIDVTSSVFGDPCPDTYKYLEIHYSCQTQKSQPRSEINLPPWLLKMSATTAKPVPSTTTTTQRVEEITEVQVPVLIENALEPLAEEIAETLAKDTIEPLVEEHETIVVESLEPVLEELELEELEELYENEIASADRGLEERREFFINLPLSDPEVETVETGGERTVLIATLVSLISCSLVIFVSALLYTRAKKNKENTLRRETIVPSVECSQYQDYKNHQSSLYDYDAVSSGSSTVSSLYTTIPNISTVGSVYTTLPNGDRAIIIPIHADSKYLQHILSNKMEMGLNPTFIPSHAFLQPTGANQLHQPAPVHQSQPSSLILNPENIYIDIDQERRY